MKINEIKDVFAFKIGRDIFSFFSSNAGNFYYKKLGVLNSLSTANILFAENLGASKSIVTFKTKLRFKGLGYKARMTEENVLELKIGYSHRCDIFVPEKILVTVLKNMLVFESTDSALLGDFVYRVFSLRKHDPYKGKGFSYKHQEELKKVVKKK